MNRIVTLLGRHWQSLLLLNAAIITSVIAFKLAFHEETWQAGAKLVIPETTSKLDANLGALGSLRTDNPSFSQQVNPLNLQISILTSDVVMERALAQDPEKDSFETVEDYKEQFVITPEEQTTTLKLSTIGDEPEIAQQRLSLLIDTFKSRLNELRTSENDARETFSQEKLNQARADLAQARQQLVEFQQGSGWVEADVQTEELVKLINTLQAQTAQVEATALASANQASILSARIGLSPDQAIAALGLNENTDYQLIRQQLTQATVDLGQAQADFTNAHPQVKLLQRRQAQLAQQLQQFVASTGLPLTTDPAVSSGAEGRTELIQQMVLADAQANAQQLQANQLQENINNLTQRLNQVPGAKAQLLALQQQYDVAEGIYRGLLAQTQQSNINAFTAYPNVQTLDPPRVDTEPVGPNLKLILANALLASVAGTAALLLFLEGRDPLVVPEDLHQTQFDCVAQLPWFRTLSHVRSQSNGKSSLPIDFQWLGSLISAQLKTGSYVLITSAATAEGKTTVTLGLAEALSHQGFRILAVDTDALQRDLCQALGYEPTAVMAGQLVHVKPKLDLMVFDDLYRNQFQQALKALKAEQLYDYILIDSTSMSERVEPSLINQFVNNVLFVLKPKSSRKRLVEKSLKQIRRHKPGFLGLVVNGASTATDTYQETEETALSRV